VQTCKNPKCQKETSNAKFCSKSCAAQVTNRESPKRSVEGSCASCDAPVASARKYCSSCRSTERRSLPSKSIHEVLYGGGHKSNRYGYVRWHAKKICKDRPQSCVRCGYEKHVEVCHIKGIKDFDPSTPLVEVNAPENLLLLCPNCHWEHDHP